MKTIFPPMALIVWRKRSHNEQIIITDLMIIYLPNHSYFEQVFEKLKDKLLRVQHPDLSLPEVRSTELLPVSYARAGSQVIRPFSAAFIGQTQGAESEAQQLGHEPATVRDACSWR